MTVGNMRALGAARLVFGSDFGGPRRPRGCKGGSEVSPETASDAAGRARRGVLFKLILRVKRLFNCSFEMVLAVIIYNK
jgi:hypothetical protein